jgi:Flp pilus assembly protein TadG
MGDLEVKMTSVKNQKGTVLVFVTLMIVLLMIMVGMGLDTGHLAYIRSQGQPAVDAAALAAASAIHTGDTAQVENRAKAFNSTNNYLDSQKNQIDIPNITYVNYNASTNTITSLGNTIAGANGVRVALETTNPYGGAGGTAMKSPLFLTPLFNLFGIPTAKTTNVSVSAVAIVKTAPDLPIAMEQGLCPTAKDDKGQIIPVPTKLLQSNSADETSGYTTFYINNASKTEINNLLQGSLTCSSAASVGIGFCTELNNGQISTIYDDFNSVFLKGKTEGRCYMIPVVATGVTYNQCSTILDFAKFCPTQSDTLGDAGWGIGKTKSEDGQGWDKYIIGNVTCGENLSNAPWAKCHVTSLVRDAKSGM